MVYCTDLYRHEIDKKAFESLNKFSALVNLQKSYMKNFDERASKINLLSTAIRLNENQMPEIYNLLPPICEKLGIPVPELYYIKSSEMNAYTYGSTNPYIVVTSKIVNKLKPNLLATVLAHECGHIACNHSLYHAIARTFINGIDNSPLTSIPAIGKYITPTLVNALLFWYRCSEFSADRAAALCDGGSEKTMEVLLRVSGYDNINRTEFLKQAIDLNELINDSKSNLLMEKMITKNESHPRLATRIFECDKWSKTNIFKGILEGSYTLETFSANQEKPCEVEVINAQINIESTNSTKDLELDEINNVLNKINNKLERYTNKADMADYSFAIFSGIMSSLIDILFVGEINITNDYLPLSHKQINKFIENFAKANGIKKDNLRSYINALEKEFKVPQDNAWSIKDIGISASNHHLADFAHHPTPLGLLTSIIAQFLRIGTFVNKDGKWYLIFLKPSKKEFLKLVGPAVLTGFLNWIVSVSEKKLYEQENVELPKGLSVLLHGVASSHMILEVAKCANNWFGHLVSDMGGSKNTPDGGMGIPGVFLSFLYEVAAILGLKDSELPLLLNNIYYKGRFDLRDEFALVKAAGKQSIPVIFNELFVRTGYFLSHLIAESVNKESLKDINWNNVIPFNNRTVDRMLAVSSMTFNLADTVDASMHAAIESGGNWVLFSGKFVSRYNYVNAGRTAVAIVKEISNEAIETQLIHEKMILSEAKASIYINKLQEFKTKLEENLINYLAEDIESFMEGFTYINQGIESGDSDKIIKGNVIIQKVLGKQPQFTNQKEFDDLMDSDLALKL